MGAFYTGGLPTDHKQFGGRKMFKGLQFRDGTESRLEVGDIISFRKEDNSLQVIMQVPKGGGNNKMPLNLEYCGKRDDRMFGGYAPGLNNMPQAAWARLFVDILAMAGVRAEIGESPNGNLYALVTEAHGEKIHPATYKRLMGKLHLPPKPRLSSRSWGIWHIPF